MCGIVGAVAERSIAPILLEGLKRLEYRGYDSAGMALLEPKSNNIQCLRVLGKVAGLEEALQKKPLLGTVGIAHTRWATHGQPTEANAHPHCSHDKIAVVHNGIIENHDSLRAHLKKQGYQFSSETDTEVICHLIHHHFEQTHNMLTAITLAAQELKGAFALGIVSTEQPNHVYAVRQGSPLVIGLGIGENFIASDPLALLPVTQLFIYLEEGDIAQIELEKVSVFDANGQPVTRKTYQSEATNDTASKGQYRHFMLKEIYEQPRAIADTMENFIINHRLTKEAFGHKANTVFPKIKRVQIVACGTSYHAGLVARYWLESIAKMPTNVEIASEYRYRDTVVEPNTLLVALSQSGETADTLAALRKVKQHKNIAGTLAICNVPESSLVRESDVVFLTRAGAEIGVAATKTFTAQLTALLLLTLALAEQNNISIEEMKPSIDALAHLPTTIKEILKLDKSIQTLSHEFVDKNHALFLGRGNLYPIALEGALKLKEISYMHAEAYPAGELKHGPLALVDKDMPVVIIAPNNTLLEKLESNMHEVHARGGQMYVFADHKIQWQPRENMRLIHMPSTSDLIAPIAYTLPLQLLSYHVAVLRGTDVDQPRNLAKSVTVE